TGVRIQYRVGWNATFVAPTGPCLDCKTVGDGITPLLSLLYEDTIAREEWDSFSDLSSLFPRTLSLVSAQANEAQDQGGTRPWTGDGYECELGTPPGEVTLWRLP